MGSFLQTDEEDVRISTSPRRSPQITSGVGSPVRSVHPQMQQMDSVHSQPDFGLRTADFFENSSEDEYADEKDPADIAPDLDQSERRASAIKKRHGASPAEPSASQCDSKRTLRPDNQGYQRLTPTIPDEGNHQAADTPSSSFNGSVDELLPGDTSSPPGFLRRTHAPSGRTPRSSAQIERSADRKSILGAFAIAHEITLQALKRDEDVLDNSLQAFPLAHLQAGDRSSLLPPSLRIHDDPRSPRHHQYSTPPSNGKKVQVVPPPIDTSAKRQSLPDDLIRTPYPYTPENVFRKDLGRSPPSATASTPISPAESILIFRIRHSNPNSKLRVTSLTIPASNEISAVRSGGQVEKELRALEFDDAALFRDMKKCYAELSGFMRFISARSLTRIAVSGSASKAADARYGWLCQPRSPRTLVYQGLSDTFSEEKILQHYRNPTLGRSRFAFVHWAHRLAAAPPVRTSGADSQRSEMDEQDLVRRMKQPEGLEFVVSWSITRILFILVAILVISMAASLLWVLLGHNTVASSPPQGGFRDAGDRIVPGVVMGICILLVGLTTMAGWLGVSWLVM